MQAITTWGKGVVQTERKDLGRVDGRALQCRAVGRRKVLCVRSVFEKFGGVEAVIGESSGLEGINEGALNGTILGGDFWR
jgi:hypothetical protein